MWLIWISFNAKTLANIKIEFKALSSLGILKQKKKKKKKKEIENLLIIAQRNLNSLRKNIHYKLSFVTKCLDVLLISETKLCDSFPTAQALHRLFHIEEQTFPKGATSRPLKVN